MSGRVLEARRLVQRLLPSSCADIGRHWIGGEWVGERGGEALDVIDPTTGQVLHQVLSASSEEVAAATRAASEAKGVWWALGGQERASILWNIAAGIRDRRDDLGTLDTLDAGRPIRDTTVRDVERAARTFEYFAGVTDRLRGATIPVQPGLRNATQLEPHGVVAAITPWNYPLSNAATKIAPALATGNSVILKPAEDAPLSALLLMDVVHQAGLPGGVLNLVNGTGSTVGSSLVRSPDVNKIAFTGSTAVGRIIASTAGEALKPVTLELGGKSACVVFEDADLQRASAAVLFSILANQGQTCTAATRLVVHRTVKQQLLDLIRAKARKVRVGDPLHPDTDVGPLISRKQLDRIQSYNELGVNEGAQREFLNVDWKVGELQGHFVRPVLFTGVAPVMKIHCEEIFGPVLVVIDFETEEEAIAAANSTDFGLATSVWTESLGRAERFSAAAESGLVWINTVHSLHAGSPYGGFRQSGLGHEMGTEAVSQFMRIKSVWTAMKPWQSPWARE